MAITPKEREIQKLIRFYRNAVKDLTTRFVSGLDSQERLFALSAEGIRILNDLDEATDRWARRNITKLYEAIRKETRGSIEKLGIDYGTALLAKAFAVVDRRAIEALLNDPEIGFLTSLRSATDEIKRRLVMIHNQARALIRQQKTINQVIARVGIFEGQNLATLRKAIVEELIKAKTAGDMVYRSKVIGAVDEGSIWSNIANLPMVRIPTKAGARYLRIDKYAEVVARTKTIQATSLARRASVLEAGHELIAVSNNLSIIDDACNVYIGRAFALTAGAKVRYGVPHVDELPNGGCPFHPNCTHSEFGFYPELEEGERLDAALTRPPDWALNQPWPDVQKAFEANGGMAYAMETNPNMAWAQNTGGRRERIRASGGEDVFGDRGQERRFRDLAKEEA